MERLIILLVQVTAQTNGVSDESTKAFLREFGFPMFVALSLMLMFVLAIGAMIRKFFKNMEDANQERKEITARFTAVLEGSLQSNTQQLTLANRSLEQSCDAIGRLDEKNTVQHEELRQDIKVFSQRIETCGQRIEGLSQALATGKRG